jgi:short-subunit dehydrogenase
MARPLALITGASSGIGSVFARKLAQRGFDLILVARRQDRLDQAARELSGVAVATLAADLSTDAGIEAVARRIAAEPALEVLVNNAGFGLKGRFWETTAEEQLRMQRVHVEATLRLTHAALQRMVERGRGGIINVSSVAAFARSQGNVGYSASKGWINDFTEALHLELRGIGSYVRVQALCPGFTYTEFHDAMGVGRKGIPRWLWMNADAVVEASLDGLDRRRLFVVPGLVYKLTTMLMPRLPTGLRLRLESASPHTKHRLAAKA